jgi:transposase-like protein
MANTRYSAEDWRRIIREAESDPTRSVQQYCYEHHLNTKTYYSWRKKLGLKPDTQGSAFVELSPQAKSQTITIITPDGLRIELPTDIDDERLTHILGAVRTP